jgi:beta-glucosidase
MGGEFKTKGVNVLLGPVVGPAWRIVRGGRNWEGFSVDPWLSGQLVAQTVSGIQGQGVITSTKVSIFRATLCHFQGELKLSMLIPSVLQHYIGNEQETNRNPEGNISAVSSNIDDETIHEVYLW